MGDICVRCVSCGKAQHCLKPALIAFRCVICGTGAMTPIRDVSEVSQEDDRYTFWRSACGALNHLGAHMPPAEICPECKVPITWKLSRSIGELLWSERCDKTQNIKHNTQHAVGRRGVAGESDPVNSPAHYRRHESGIECIQITEHMNFCLGNAVKYIWRAGLKSECVAEDLQKAIWYLERELQRMGSDR